MDRTTSSFSLLTTPSASPLPSKSEMDKLQSPVYLALVRNHLHPEMSSVSSIPFDMAPEDDDAMHDPQFDPSDKPPALLSVLCTWRALENVGCLVILTLAIFTLFAVYPMITGIRILLREDSPGALGLGGINSTGQVPALIGDYGLVDPSTPNEAYTHTSLETGEAWDLVFSDEFNVVGRSFYPGDDPFWQAEDLHYWSTENLEWSDPRRTTTVDGGYLRIELAKVGVDTLHPGLDYEGTYLTTWNKFCFTGGYVEAAVSLPGRSDVYG
jgi:hypothetical protein